MYITQHTDYALRTLIFVATHPERLVNITEISEIFNISRSHLTKVVANLTRHNYLKSIRGKGGGLQLARAASDINLKVVIQTIEPMLLAECFDENNQCMITPYCRLSTILVKALNAFLDILEEYTLADLIADPKLALLFQKNA